MDKYVVIARFDDETNERLIKFKKDLFSSLCLEEYSEWPMHITIAAYEEVDINQLCEWTESYANKHKPISIRFSSFGVFPPGKEHTDTAVIYLAPASSRELISFYYGFHDKLDEYCGNLGWWYSAECGFPTIHTTIGVFSVEKIQEVFEKVFNNDISGKALITSIEIYTYPMKLIKRCDLGQS